VRSIREKSQVFSLAEQLPARAREQHNDKYLMLLVLAVIEIQLSRLKCVHDQEHLIMPPDAYITASSVVGHAMAEIPEMQAIVYIWVHMKKDVIAKEGSIGDGASRDCITRPVQPIRSVALPCGHPD
jgi:hypothetical protein